VAPPALQVKVQRTAKIIQRHQRVLGTVGIEALRTATLQVVAQQLADIQALLQANGLAGASVAGRSGTTAPAVAPTGPACAMCGRQPVVYFSKTARVEKGQHRPGYCAGHAGWARKEDGEAVIGRTLGLVAPAGAPSLSAAMETLGDGESA
jgi:hypothetical protein